MQKAFWKCCAVCAGVLLAVSLTAAPATDDPAVARYHFAGTSQLTGDAYAAARKALNSTNATDYRELVLNRFAQQIGSSLGQTRSAIRPLLDNLLASESTGAFGVPGNGPEEFVVAVKLGANDAAKWSAAAKGAPSLRFQKVEDWVVVARGNSLKAVEDKFVADIHKNHRPAPSLKDTALEATIDWPRLSNLPALASFAFKPALLQLKVTPKGNHFRTEIHAHYPEAIAWKAQPWHLPTETIRDPLVSFTAGQNAAAFMKPIELFQRIGENPFTNQYFIWANLNIPFETSALFPMKDAQRHLQALGRELPSQFNPELEKNHNGQLKWLEETNKLIWRDVPILAPFVQAIHEKAGEFLFVGTFARVTGPEAPSDLWSQFKRSDLVYYDWEIAGPRLMQWRMLTPLLPIYPMARSSDDTRPHNTKTKMASPRNAVDNWLTGLTATLTPTKDKPANGNVVTEVTRKNASDYTIVRSSQLGFTGVELFMLSHWLAGTHPSELPRLTAPPPGTQHGQVRKLKK